MKKTKLFIPLLTTAIIATPAIASLSSCSKNNEVTRLKISFKADKGGVISTFNYSNVTYGIKWRNVPEPEYIEQDRYVFIGWYNGDHLMHNEDVITSDMTITAKFAFPTNANDFKWSLNSKSKIATLSKYNGHDSNVIVPKYYVLGKETYTVASIGTYAFDGCTNVSSIVLPSTITLINNGAFDGCTNLASIHLPRNATEIVGHLFAGCKNLSSITVDKKNQFINDGYGCNAIITKNKQILISGSNITTIPNDGSVVTIHHSAFSYCDGIKFTSVPKSVAEIGKGAFAYCNGLTTMYLPENVSTIGKGAFTGCTNLTSISLPNSLQSLEGSTFEGCSKLSTIDASRMKFSKFPREWRTLKNVFQKISPSGVFFINNESQRESWTRFLQTWLNFDESSPNHWKIEIRQ